MDHASSGSEEEQEKVESEEVETLRAEMQQVKEELATKNKRVKDMWRLNCHHIAEMDKAVTEKDEEINRLKHELARFQRSSPSIRSEVSDVTSASIDDSRGSQPGCPRIR